MPQQQQPIGRAGQAALLTWVNTFALDRRVERLEELADGQVFAQMLHDLDAEYDPAELEQNTGSSAWLTNKRNIQSVFKALTRYIIHKDKSGAIEFLPRTVDVRAISDNLNAEGLAQLVALFVATAMLGSHNTQYIPVMRSSLTTAEQAAIMTILQRKAEERQRLAEGGAEGSMDEAEAAAAAPGTMPGTRTRDAGLVAEARLATLAADYDRLSKRLADSNTRLEHLQMSYEAIKEELERKEKELDLERQSHGASESQLVRELQEKLREQDELISGQEAQAEEDRVARQRLTQESVQLLRRAELVEPLQDQVQELRHANEELSKKANTVDRYKQKLEAQRGLETDLQNALYELGQNKEALKEFEALQRRGGQQLATIERFREMVSGLEQQIEDNRLQRAALEGDVYAAHVQLESLRDQSQLSEARIAELEQQLLVHGIVLVGGGGGGGGGSGEHGGVGGDGHGGNGGAGSGADGVPGSAGGSRGGADGGRGAAKTSFSLEDELQQQQNEAATSEPTAQSLELARLRAENGLLRGRLDAGTEGDHRLRTELETTRAKEEAARQQYSALLEKHAVAEAQVQALLGGKAGEGSAVLAEARERLQATAGERDEQAAAAAALERQVADGQRELLRLRGDLAAVDKGSLAEALAELQATDRLVSESLSQEVASLRRELRALQVDKEQQQQLLVEALLSRGVGKGGVVGAETAKEAADEAGNGKTSEAEDQLRRTSEKNEKLRAAVKQLKKQYDAAELERQELQRRVRAAEATPGSAAAAAAMAAQRAASEQALRSLQRENALIATAWYGLTSRLQSNHVVLQRRQDVPKSWLNKQRQMVNGPPRLAGRGVGRRPPSLARIAPMDHRGHSRGPSRGPSAGGGARGRADRRRAARLRFRLGVIAGIRADIRTDIRAGVIAGFHAVAAPESTVSVAVALAVLVAAAAVVLSVAAPLPCALLLVGLCVAAALFSPLLCAAAYYRYTLVRRRPMF